MNKVTIMRGVSGSGKSTRAWELCQEQGGIMVSADHYFEDAEGNYNFNPRDIGKAHAYCMHRFLRLLQLGEPHIIVDNTNTQNWEFYNYEAAAELAGYEVVFEEMPCRDLDDVRRFAERNKHNVPYEAVKAMFERWEER